MVFTLIKSSKRFSGAFTPVASAFLTSTSVSIKFSGGFSGLLTSTLEATLTSTSFRFLSRSFSLITCDWRRAYRCEGRRSNWTTRRDREVTVFWNSVRPLYLKGEITVNFSVIVDAFSADLSFLSFCVMTISALQRISDRFERKFSVLKSQIFT